MESANTDYKFNTLNTYRLRKTLERVLDGESREGNILEPMLELIDNGADPSVKTGKERQNILHVIAGMSHYNVVDILIDAGADYKAQDLYGDVPLFKAIMSGNELAVEALSSTHIINKDDIFDSKTSLDLSLFELMMLKGLFTHANYAFSHSLYSNAHYKKRAKPILDLLIGTGSMQYTFEFIKPDELYAFLLNHGCIKSISKNKTERLDWEAIFDEVLGSELIEQREEFLDCHF